MLRGNLASLQVFSQLETKRKVIHRGPLYIDCRQLFLRSGYATICLLIIP